MRLSDYHEARADEYDRRASDPGVDAFMVVTCRQLAAMERSFARKVKIYEDALDAQSVMLLPEDAE